MRTTTPSAPAFDGSQPCMNVDPELWFPEPGTYSKGNTMAKEICVSCRFRQPCLQYAVENRVEGIWGGMGTTEREAYRARLRRQAVAA